VKVGPIAPIRQKTAYLRVGFFIFLLATDSVPAAATAPATAPAAAPFAASITTRLTTFFAFFTSVAALRLAVADRVFVLPAFFVRLRVVFDDPDFLDLLVFFAGISLLL
jgi:hypothetical protein